MNNLSGDILGIKKVVF